MALINIVPFDLNRRPGRPTKTQQNKGTPKTTATDAIHKTPEQRPLVNQGYVNDRRHVERRHRYKPMQIDRRAEMRRNHDNLELSTIHSESTTTSIDVEV